MWTAITTELPAASRWNVSLFAADVQTASDAVYDAVPIGELVAPRREALNPPDYPDHLFNYLGLEHVAPLTGDLVGFSPTIGSGVRSRSKVFHSGDLLYGRLRANLNKVYLAEAPVEEGICSGEFYVLIPDTALVMPRFLRCLLASDFVLAHVGRLQGGSALPRLDLDDLLRLEVPLPPREVQEEMAAFIGTQDARRRAIAHEAHHLPRLIAAVLAEALESGGPLRPPIVPSAPTPLVGDGLPQKAAPSRRRGRPPAHRWA